MPAHVQPALQPDPHLPHRDLLLDGPVVCEWLSRHMSTNGPVAFDGFQRARVKYRVGESLRVVYRLRAGAEEWVVAARMFPSGRSGGAFREGFERAVPVGRLRGIGHASTFDTVFWTFPNDRKLRSLALLQPPAPLLLRVLGRDALDTRMVAYAPEKSATVSCRTPSGEVVAYAKVYADEQARRATAIYREVHQGLSAHGSVRVPRVLGASARHRMVLLEAIEGVALSTLPHARQEAAVERLGAALAALHGLPPPDASFLRLQPERLMRAASRIGDMRPDVDGLARALVGALAARRGDHAGDPLVRLHGDVHPKNAIVADGRVALVDLDQSAAGPAAADLGSFLAYLRAEQVQGALSAGAERLLAHAFLAGYQETRALPDANSLRWQTAAALLAERALRAVNRVRPEALACLEDLLASATDLARS